VSSSQAYPKRLIEVDLPIRRISEHARREKSIRHGHLSTMHLWWARRPLGACRAVLCSALWPDPADSACPRDFVETATRAMLDWANSHAAKASAESFPQLVRIQKQASALDDHLELRRTLLDFIADCVMAGMGRSGTVYPLNLEPEVLMRAFANTVELLKKEVVVE